MTGGLELIDERRKSLTFGTAAATIDGVSYPATLNPATSFYNPDPSIERGEPYPTGAFTDGETTTAALYRVRFSGAESAVAAERRSALRKL